MAVPPGDVAADHAVLFAVGGVVGAVQGELAQRGELTLNAVHPRAVRGRAGDLGVAGGGPGADALVFPGGQVRAVVIADDRDPHLRRVQAAQVPAELEELPAPLALLDVPVHLVGAQVQGGEQVPHPAGAVVGGPQPPPRRLARLAGGAAAAGPLPARPRLQVQRAELVHAKDHLRVAGPGGGLAVGDRVQVLYPGLLGRVIRIRGRLPGLHALKGHALRAQQFSQALVGDVLDHPLGDQEVGQLGQAPPGKRQPVIGRGGLGDLLDLPPLGQREHRRVPAGVPRVQRVKAVGAEVVQHVADPVLAGKSQPRDLRHAHALRRPQHHLRPPPRHHRPGPAAHDPFQAITLVIADLTHSHPASHTRQCDPINQRTESQKAALARRKQGKRRQLRH